MAFKVFLDANILLDFALRRDRYDISKEVIKKVIDGEIEAFITPSIVHIVGYWLTKAYGASTAKEILLSLLTDIKVIDCSHSVTVNALNSAITDIENALQYYTALNNKMDYFITQDKKLEQAAIPNLPVYLPEDFLKEIDE